MVEQTSLSMPLIVVIVIVVILIFSVIGMYNKLVTLKNRFKNAFSQIDVQLTRRYELIPNLVETAKKFMSHERETLENVIKARNQAIQMKAQVGGDPTDPSSMGKLMQAETMLTKSMGGLFALAENYPQLKSDATMKTLMEELTSTENKVSFARQGYNDAVMEYNTAREVFPTSVIAGMFNFSAAKLFEVQEQKVREAVKVAF